ncbi:MAG: GNAT family N-acetyltransferase [Pedobacter sp.]|uniref:GNAT family N-acetyltransferase n=1 Tax=Pedobacter sp. TaxID=1411316 RepID=UPI003395F7E3
MELKITTRKIEESDFEYIYNALCQLENQILNREITLEIFNENITNPNFLYLIAEINNEKAGFITFHTQKLMHHSGLVGEIEEFYVDAQYRSKGVGRELITTIRSFAELKNLKSIEVTTNKRRTENVAIYQSLGFNLSHNKFTIYRT